MLLRALKLKDFRQFRGEQTISFSTDPEQNVTVIMGENGSGKTTLAQAFTWCLYGDTDFDDKSMLCKATAQAMLPNSEQNVRVELSLTHSGRDYVCIREQRYSKDASGNLRRPGQPIFKIAFKGKDGQREFVPDGETELRKRSLKKSSSCLKNVERHTDTRTVIRLHTLCHSDVAIADGSSEASSLRRNGCGCAAERELPDRNAKHAPIQTENLMTPSFVCITSCAKTKRF